tara:strand:+ start:1679 stop:3679 length:2001 start_codon:yes stop_codon:yes gene_type:complete
MLKFIRKYQMVILVIGGSLLMVVFLLQPVLERLAPSPLKAKVASLDDGTVFTRGEIIRAQAAVTLLARSNPRALQPMSLGGLGLDSESERTAALHWLMFADMAKRAGLVGEIGDGASWIDQIAEQEALLMATNEARQGAIPFTSEAIQSQASNYKQQIVVMINRNANAAASSMSGSMEDVYRTLAEARGMYRLVNSVYGTPSFSDIQAIDATKNLYDAVAVNAVVIDSNLIADSIEDPNETELEAFFQRFSSEQSTENEFGIGYTMPTRIKLGWIALNKQDFMDAVEIDRVEIQKIWKRDRDTYPGDFAAERTRIEQQYREEQATSMMIEADRLIRAQILAKTNSFSKVNGKTQLPDDWASQAPQLDVVAESVTERLSEQFGFSMPTIQVSLIGDRWLSSNDILALPGIGFSWYRVGSNQIQTRLLPQFFAPDYEGNIDLDVQKMLPIVEQAATDAQGNRYYAMVLDVRDAGPADGISDVGRERVVADYKSLKAFELIETQSDELASLARENDNLAPVVDRIMSMTSNESAVHPSVLRQILVRKDTIDRGPIANSVNPRLNNESFRSAVLEAAEGLDPLVDPSELKQNPIVVAEPLPQTRSFAFSIVLAPRPLTLEQFRANAAAAMRQAGSAELRDAGFFDSSPFSFESLSERYGLKILQEDEDES